MINALIIEDEKHCADRLLQLLEPYKNTINILEICNTVSQGIITTQKYQPDLVFLDVQINNETGFDYLQQLKAINFEIIFTTAFENFAIKAIKFSALDYLLKPIDTNDFKIAIQKLQQKLNTNTLQTQVNTLLYNLDAGNSLKQITVPTINGFDVVKVANILYCEAQASYTKIVTKTETLIASKPLKFYENLLEDHRFYRIHNSHLVNLNYVKKYTKGKGGYITLSNNESLNVSTRKKEGFLKLLNI